MTSTALDGAPAAERPRLVIIVSMIQGSPGRFRAHLEGSDAPLVQSSRQPFVDSGRALIAAGHDGNAVLIMKHASSDTIALKATLAIAAKLAVEEGPNGPRFVPYRTGEKSRVAASPIAESGRTATPASRTPISSPASLLHGSSRQTGRGP
jgi:hypothetical protein